MTIVAFDLGASSGRTLLGRLTDNKMEIEEIHRFPNDPVQVGDRLHWDILRLYHEVKTGLLKAKNAGQSPRSIGIDSWAVDFGFIGKKGELLGNPYHYRDPQTEGMMEQLFAAIPPSDIFGRTGIQFLPFNTIFQLFALQRSGNPMLGCAERFLMIPELLRYFLTGELHNEFTNATTTQLYNPTEKRWDPVLLQAVGARDSWFGPVLHPGSAAGHIRSAVRKELGIDAIPVIAVAEHDTGSAVVAVPALHPSFAFLSCGTWSLMGTEVEQPVMKETARLLNFTNEGGACGTYRLLKNIMGLWILQECQREWQRKAYSYTFPELVRLAEDAPAFTAVIDPDDPRFLAPGDMTPRIRDYCQETGQKTPDGPGAVARCILESLALKYRYVLELTERVADKRFEGLHMLGGGIQNTLLCQWTANAIGKPVWAGPAEGSGIGNLAVQWIAQGEFADIWEARKVIRDSFPVTTYEPSDKHLWEKAYGDFLQMIHAVK